MAIFTHSCMGQGYNYSYQCAENYEFQSGVSFFSNQLHDFISHKVISFKDMGKSLPHNVANMHVH